MDESTDPQSPDASPQPNRYIRHVYLSASEMRDGGGFYLDQQEYILQDVLRSDGSGLDMLIVVTP